MNGIAKKKKKFIPATEALRVQYVLLLLSLLLLLSKFSNILLRSATYDSQDLCCNISIYVVVQIEYGGWCRGYGCMIFWVNTKAPRLPAGYSIHNIVLRHMETDMVRGCNTVYDVRCSYQVYTVYDGLHRLHPAGAMSWGDFSSGCMLILIMNRTSAIFHARYLQL